MWAKIGIPVALALLGGVLLISSEPSKSNSEQPRPAQPAPSSAEPGSYPPAESLASGMTEEWRAFADEIDRVCAVTYNAMSTRIALVEEAGAARGWSEGRIEQARLQLSANQGAQILKAAADLGPPPERADLFERWRGMLAKRVELKTRAAEEAGDGHFYVRANLMNRTYRIKDRQDLVGQRFGLRICTSN